MYHKVSFLKEQKKQIEEALENCSMSLQTFQPNKHLQSLKDISKSERIVDRPFPYPVVKNICETTSCDDPYIDSFLELTPSEVLTPSEGGRFVCQDGEFIYKQVFHKNKMASLDLKSKSCSQTTWTPPHSSEYIGRAPYFTGLHRPSLHHRKPDWLKDINSSKLSQFKFLNMTSEGLSMQGEDPCQNNFANVYKATERNIQNDSQLNRLACMLNEEQQTSALTEARAMSSIPRLFTLQPMEDSNLDTIFHVVEETLGIDEGDDISQGSEEELKSASRTFKSAVPFKKRVHTETYPKSRFIDARKIPIFDLTVEEEFRIHDINFRRDLAWKSYIQSMKETVSNFESFKANIFLSAFGLNRVVTKPEDWSSWSSSAMKNHVKSANYFEEISELPPHIWNKIKFENTKTWSTYSWSLCWANVDSENLIEQESKAGFWDYEFQVKIVYVQLNLSFFLHFFYFLCLRYLHFTFL